MARVHAYVRRRTLMETVKHEQDAKHSLDTINERQRLETDATDLDHEHQHSRGIYV